MRNFFQKCTLAPLILLTLAACDGIPTGLSGQCKPVVPEVVVTWKNSAHAALPRELMILYHEAGGVPGKPKAQRGSARMSHCTTSETQCVSPRARYEVRTDPERRQRIELRELNGNGNPVISEIEWHGPSYPHRVIIDCDLKEQNRLACTLERLNYEVSLVQKNPHDQCTPRT